MPAPSRRPSGSAPVAGMPIAFAQAAAWACQRRGVDVTPLLRAAQIAPSQLRDATCLLRAEQVEALSAAAMQALDDEALGAYSRPLPWGSYGMLARASLTAPNLGVALRRWCRHHGLLTPDVRLNLERQGNWAVVALHERKPLPAAVRAFSLTHLLRNLQGLACWYVDSRIDLQAAALPCPPPPQAPAYALLLGCPVTFDAARAQIAFDARYLDLPLRRDERALQQMLQRALPLAVQPYRRDRLLASRVRQTLVAQPTLTRTARDAAAQLHLSVRTLHRQLQEENTSWQQIKDEARCEAACEQLWRTRQPIKQVAAAVGFLNEKSFIRAFTAWTGLAPGAFRQAGALASEGPALP